MVANSRVLVAIVGAIFFAIAGEAAAHTVAFNNFDAGGGYDNAGIWFGRGGELELWFAQRFEPTITGELQSIETAMRVVPAAGGINQVTLSIRADGVGEPGIAELWRHTYDDELSTSFSATSTFPVSGGPTLEEGIKYWLIAEAPPVGEYAYLWQAALVGSEASASYYVDGEESYPLNTWLVNDPHPELPSGFAMRLLVVPEPSAAIGLSLAALLLVVCGTPMRRSRN